MQKTRVRNANKILSEFLVGQRMNASLSIDRVADLIGKTPEEVRALEAQPLKIPSCQLSELIRVYRIDPFDLQDNLLKVSAVIRKPLV